MARAELSARIWLLSLWRVMHATNVVVARLRVTSTSTNAVMQLIIGRRRLELSALFNFRTRQPPSSVRAQLFVAIAFLCPSRNKNEGLRELRRRWTAWLEAFAGFVGFTLFDIKQYSREIAKSGQICFGLFPLSALYIHFGPRSVRSFFEDRTDRGPKWLKTDLVESLRSLGPNCTSEGPICTSW